MSNYLSDEKKEELAKLAKEADEPSTDCGTYTELVRKLKNSISPATISSLIEENAELREIGREQAVTLHHVLYHPREFEDCDIQRCAEWQKIPVTELTKQRALAAEAERDKLQAVLLELKPELTGWMRETVLAALKSGEGEI